MKFFVCLLFIAIICMAIDDILAQQVRYHNLLYYPRPTPPPRILRVRRQALTGSVAGNPNGGSDLNLKLSKGIGTPEHNLIGAGFAAGNSERGPITTGAGLNYNNNGHGLGVSASHTPGVIDTFRQDAHVNLLKNDRHSLDANAFATQNKQANGFQFERNGFGLDYNHANGHGASLTHANIPGFGRQLELGGRANLWTSPNRNTQLDLTGKGSQWLSGPLSGQRDFGAGLGLTHYFG